MDGMMKKIYSFALLGLLATANIAFAMEEDARDVEGGSSLTPMPKDDGEGEAAALASLTKSLTLAPAPAVLGETDDAASESGSPITITSFDTVLIGGEGDQAITRELISEFLAANPDLEAAETKAGLVSLADHLGGCETAEAQQEYLRLLLAGSKPE